MVKMLRAIKIMLLSVLIVTAFIAGFGTGSASERDYNEKQVEHTKSNIYSITIYKDGTARITTNQMYLQEPIESHLLVITDKNN